MRYYNSRGGCVYAILNSSACIDKNMAERLLRKGALIPQFDGMFGDSQTYKALELVMDS